MQRRVLTVPVVLVACVMTAAGCRKAEVVKPKAETPAPAATLPPATTPPVAPPPAPPAPKPAPLPASVIYLPTGVKASSVLAIEKSCPTKVVVGKPFEYVIKVSNISPQALANVTLTEAIPSNFSLISSSMPGSNGTYELGLLTAGETRTIVLKGSAAASGTISSVAKATYVQSLVTNIMVVQPSLQLTQTLQGETVLGCGSLTLAVEIRNVGTGDAADVHAMSSLPAGLTFAGGATSFDEVVGVIPAGEIRRVTREVIPAAIGVFETRSAAKADGIGDAGSNVSRVTIRQPRLQVTTVSELSFSAGQQGCCELVVTNVGDAPSHATRLALTLPAGLAAATLSDGGAANAWNLGDLAPGESRTVKLCLAAAAGGESTLTASATGRCAAPGEAKAKIVVK
jgi:hypothetical protein